MNSEKQHIWIWVKFMDYEFRSRLNGYNKRGYTHMIDNIINPILIYHLFKDNEKAIELCKEGADGIKFINGDHFHIYLFLELEKMIKDLK
jgi:hypothetical protein